MRTEKLTKLAKGFFLAAAFMTTVIACGKKNADNNQNVNAFTQSCVNCQNITGFPFFTAQTSAYLSNPYSYSNTETLRINWSFSGQNVSSQSQASTPNQQYGSSPAMNYNGQVSAAGQVTVGALVPARYFCPQIPAGTYNLTTQTVGQWSAGAVSGLKLLITGPVNMTAILSNGQASENMYQYQSGSRITGMLQIEQVNGYYCQGLNLNLW